MLLRSLHRFIPCLLVLLVACGDNAGDQEQQTARVYCGSCHRFPEPALLDKQTWVKHVLPAMAAKVGIASYQGQYLTSLDKHDGKSGAVISFADWMKIVNFYSKEAPENIPLRIRTKAWDQSRRFAVHLPEIISKLPSTTAVKIDPGNRHIMVSTLNDSMIITYDHTLYPVSRLKTGIVTVNLSFESDVSEPGKRTGLITGIGDFFPVNDKKGSLQVFEMKTNGQIKTGVFLSEKMARPVSALIADINGDQQKDILVCAFGNETGELFYLEKKGRQYTKRIISAMPGAVNAFVDDFNNDDRPDVIALFAQGDEGIYLFLNKGNDVFETRRILRFPPVFGSSHFELVDLNGDGRKDIIYTAGDNLDYSRVLKNYHGVYIYLHSGDLQFKQKYFFPLHGCYGAIAKDFDLDNDIDILAIGYAANKDNYTQDGLIYLEQTGSLQFRPTTIPGAEAGNWMTMDSGDVDGDGDEDVVLGSFVADSLLFSIMPGADKKPPFILLENKTR